MNRLRGGEGVKRKLRAPRSLGEREREGPLSLSLRLRPARFHSQFSFHPFPAAESIHRLTHHMKLMDILVLTWDGVHHRLGSPPNPPVYFIGGGGGQGWTYWPD